MSARRLFVRETWCSGNIVQYPQWSKNSNHVNSSTYKKRLPCCQTLIPRGYIQEPLAILTYSIYKFMACSSPSRQFSWQLSDRLGVKKLLYPTRVRRLYFRRPWRKLAAFSFIFLAERHARCFLAVDSLGSFAELVLRLPCRLVCFSVGKLSGSVR